MARRSTGERSAHKARRKSVRLTRKAGTSNCGSSGFQSFTTQAQFAAFFAPAAVAARQRAAIAQARKQAAANRAFASFARRMGFKITPFKPFTAAQTAAFFASGCKTQKAMVPPRRPAKPKRRRSEHHRLAGHRPARAMRARPATSRPRRPAATRRPNRPRARRA